MKFRESKKHQINERNNLWGKLLYEFLKKFKDSKEYKYNVERALLSQENGPTFYAAIKLGELFRDVFLFLTMCLFFPREVNIIFLAFYALLKVGATYRS